MRLRSRLLPLLAVAGLAVAATAAAQDVTRDRVLMAIEATDRRIEQAGMLVSGSDNVQARTELNFAVDIQGRAKGAFVAAQLAVAARLTFEARGHADRAISIVRGLDPDNVLAQLERTREILGRARDRIEECADDRARAMLRVAFEMQDRAENAGRSGRYLAALQLTMSARERGLKALRLCRLQEDLQDGAERALQRTDEVILRARDAVAAQGSDLARQILARASALQDDAYREFRAERFAASLRLTTSARAFAYRAIRISGRGL